MPQVRTVWRTSTASNQPQRRLRPVLTPNSLPRRPISSPISFVQFGRERPLPDPGRIGLADPEHIADRARPHAGAGRRLRRHGVGRGDVGIGAVVDVEQRALRALEQDALALAALEVEQPPHRFGVRQKLRRQRGQFLQDSGAVDFLEIEAAAQRVVMRQQPVDLVRQRVEIGEIHQPDRAAADLVLIGRADAAPRGADRGDRIGGFAQRIEFAMQRQDQRDVFGDAQIFRADGDALRPAVWRLRRGTPADRTPRHCRSPPASRAAARPTAAAPACRFRR